MNHEHAFVLNPDVPYGQGTICRFGLCRGCGKQFEYELHQSCPYCGDERLPKLHTQDGQYLDCCGANLGNPFERFH